MRETVPTAVFTHGHGLAVTIPDGWLDPNQIVYMCREKRSGRIYLSHTPIDVDAFFDFLRDEEYLEDPGFEGLRQNTGRLE